MPQHQACQLLKGELPVDAPSNSHTLKRAYDYEHIMAAFVVSTKLTVDH